MSLLIKSSGEAPGVYPAVERGRQLQFLSFTVVQLDGAFNEHRIESGEEELALNFYGGPASVDLEGANGRWRVEIAGRPSLKEPGSMVYVPARSRVTLRSQGQFARILVTGAAGKDDAKPRLILADGVSKNVVGRDNWQRTVYTYIGPDMDAAHLICGETVNQPGGWASCPPHKHDRLAPPSEAPMEEIYYFQFEPKQGFGFMRVYTDRDDPEPFDYAYPIEDGDTMLVPRGYHPWVTAPGYTLNYAWMLSGEGRAYGAWTEDPAHVWVKAS